jgi:hypothetical protein
MTETRSPDSKAGEKWSVDLVAPRITVLLQGDPRGKDRRWKSCELDSLDRGDGYVRQNHVMKRGETQRRRN